MDIQDVKQNIAANLTRILADRGWSQVELSNRSGVNLMTVNRAVRAIYAPSAAALANLAQALDVSIDRLLSPPSGPISEIPAKSA